MGPQVMIAMNVSFMMHEHSMVSKQKCDEICECFLQMKLCIV
jgi:hypothetical protein